MNILHVVTRSILRRPETIVINLGNSMCKDHEISVAAGEDGPMWSALNINKIKIKEIVRQISTYMI